MRIGLIAFCLTILVLSIGCGDGVHPISNQLLPKSLLPDTGTTPLGNSTDEGALPLTTDPRGSTTTTTGAVNVFNGTNPLTGDPVAPTEPKEFQPIFSSYQKLSVSQNSLSLNGNVADKLIADRVQDGVKVNLNSLGGRLVQWVGAFTPEEAGLEEPTTIGDSPSEKPGIFTTTTTSTTSTTAIEIPQPLTTVTTTSTTTAGSTTTTTGTTTTTAAPPPSGGTTLGLPALKISPFLRAFVASGTNETPENPLADWSSQRVGDTLILNFGVNRELRFSKVTESGSGTFKPLHSTGKVEVRWDIQGETPRGLTIYGLSCDLFFDDAGEISGIKIGSTNGISISGLDDLADFSIELQGLQITLDSREELWILAIAPEVMMSLTDQGQVMKLNVKGVNGQIMVSGNGQKGSLAFAEKVGVGVEGLVVPQFLSEWVSPGRGKFETSQSTIQLDIHGLDYADLGGELADSFNFKSIEFSAEMWFKTLEGVLAGETIRSVKIKTRSPLSFIDMRLSRPLSGLLECELEMGDGQKNEFQLVGRDGGYKFQGRLRAPDGSEFEIKPTETGTYLLGSVGFQNGSVLKTQMIRSRDIDAGPFTVASTFTTLNGEKEMAIEFKRTSDGDITGFWTTWKPIFRQGEFTRDPQRGKIIVRDANHLAMAEFLH